MKIDAPNFKPKDRIELGVRYSFTVCEVQYITDHAWKYVGWILRDGQRYKYGTVSEIVLSRGKKI